LEPREVLAKLAESGTPPDAESALHISVGLDQTIKRFRDEALPFVDDGGAELQFVFAPYGRGKTHFLRSLQESARQAGFVTAYIDCRTGQSPFASLQETYRIVANNLLPPGNGSGAKGRMGADAVLEEAVLSVSHDTALARIQTVYRDGHLSSGFRNLAAAYARTAHQGQKGERLGEELRALLRSDFSTRVRVNDLYRENTWLPRPIGKLARRNAAAWVRSLACLPKTLGYPGLVILFDETEQTHSLAKLRPKARQSHLANLRNFVDHMALGTFRGCAIYYAVVEEFLETARIDLEALSQRIERVRLGPNGGAPNPRAVWVDLDELTRPTPGEESFYAALGRAIVRLGTEAGLPNSSEKRLLERFNGQSQNYSNSIKAGAVREFVKMAASHVAAEVSRHA
jgi:hypothetical protein